MGLFASKRVKELEQEKEEVLLRLNSITEKEDNVRHLNEVLKKMRIEVSELNEKKLFLSDDIELLNEQKNIANTEIEGLSREILNLRQIKLEEQNSILTYTEKIDEIKNRIENSDNEFFDEIDSVSDVSDINEKKDKIKLLQKQYDELKDKILSAEQIIEELNETEEQLNENIKDKREEFETLTAEKLNNSYEEVRKVEDRIAELIENEQRIIDEIQDKEKEITNLKQKLSYLKEEENKSTDILNNLEEEVKHKQNQAESLDAIISDLHKEEEDKKSSISLLTEQVSEHELKIDVIKKELLELEAEQKKKHSKLSKLLGQFKSKEELTEEKRTHLAELETLEKERIQQIEELSFETKQYELKANYFKEEISRLTVEEEETRKRVDELKAQLLTDTGLLDKQRVSFRELELLEQEKLTKLDLLSKEIDDQEMKSQYLKQEKSEIEKEDARLNEHIEELKNIFMEEALPLPNGFTDQDVDLNAPRLFTDDFYLHYLGFMSRIAMNNYTLILNQIARSDIRAYFSKRVYENIDLYNNSADLRLSKGIFIRAPRVEVIKNVQYVKNQSFIFDWFGEKRPLLTTEITHIFSIIYSNIVGRAITTGFGQVSKEKKHSDYFFEGKAISTKQIDELSSLLTDEAIPIPSTSDSFVTDSIVAPFSEKLMLNHSMVLASAGVSRLGMAISDTVRSDLQTKYMKYIAEDMKYSKNAADILIDNGWLEQPPQAINHESLVGV